MCVCMYLLGEEMVCVACRQSLGSFSVFVDIKLAMDVVDICVYVRMCRRRLRRGRSHVKDRFSANLSLSLALSLSLHR